MHITFEWDPEKNRANYKKHKVWFDEAKTVFYDQDARLIHDPDHTEDEDRWVMLGMSGKLRLLTVCHSYRKNDAVIRIFSARKAEKDERINYGRYIK